LVRAQEGEKFKPDIDNKKKVLQFDLNKNFITKHESFAEVLRIINASKTCIARCGRGKN